MPRAEIEYRERPKGPLTLYAHREGSKTDIRESAELLLAELRREGFKKAVVFIDGKRIQLSRKEDD